VAIAVANYVSERRTGCFQGWSRDGVHYLDASVVTTGAQLQQLLTAKLQLDTRGNQAGSNQLAELVVAARPLRALMVIVNCSSLLESDPRGVEQLLQVLLMQTRGIRLLVAAEDSLSATGIRLDGIAEKVVRLQRLNNEDSARVFFRRSPRRILPAEVGANTPMEVIRALARHPLITEVLRGHPRDIVNAVARLEEINRIDELHALLRN